MPRLHRPRYADVTATLALVIALGTGGAYAATSLISTGQIANGAVTTAKIHNNAVTSAKLAPAVRSTLNRYAFTPWGTMPHHVTVTGRFFQSGHPASPAYYHVENINLPAKSPVPLSDSNLGFGTTVGGTTKDSHCTGTFSHPTAPAGWVCVYLAEAAGFDSIFVSTWGDSAQAPYTFYIDFHEGSTTGTWNEYGTWAYTTP